MNTIANPFYSIRNCILGFKCDADWDSMQFIGEVETLESNKISQIRFCSFCQKEVYESNSDKELTENIKLNRCVSFIRQDGFFDIERTTGKAIFPSPL